MEETNNNSGIKNNSKIKFLIFGVLILIIIIIVVKLTYLQNKGNSSTQSLTPSTTVSVTPTPTVAVSTQPSQTSNTLTGNWSGSYNITSPQKCAGITGTWTASITQSNNSFSGTYQSDYSSGAISGSATSNNGFNWTVTGNGVIQLNGTVSGANKVDGNLTGRNCPGTSEFTSGTFTGQKTV